jgi:PilZ domain
VSRIWDELKQAEKQRPKSPGAHQGRDVDEEGVDNRKTKRSQPHVSLIVYGSDVEKRPFHEEADTLDINEEGCLMHLENPVVLGQRLFVVNLSNQDERECRVVRLGNTLGGKRQVAVQFLRPAPEFWFDS